MSISSPSAFATRELGKPIAEFKFARLYKSVVGLAVLGLFFWSCALLNWVISPPRAGSPLIVLMLMLVAIGLGFIGWAAFIGRTSYANRNRRIQVFNIGLVQVNGPDWTFIGWDEITVVRQAITEVRTYGIKVNTLYIYTIELKTGRTFKFDNHIENVATLGELLRQQVTRQQLPQALTKMQRGETVAFGALGVSQRGLTYEDKAIAWSEVDRVEMLNGSVVVRKKTDRLFSLPLVIKAAEIPNLSVFLALIRQPDTRQGTQR
ncbi:hypothetical protein TFLX_05257 [Thermoflexales bacterium]|nr:hypothetical protein TFLX_05257 [Thermoflexales bacterium]